MYVCVQLTSWIKSQSHERWKYFTEKYYWMFSLYMKLCHVWPEGSEAPVFYLSISGRSLTVSLFFPGGWLGKSILKQFYTQSNIITDKLDEREMKEAADYLLSVEIQMEGKRESQRVFQDHRYLNRKKKLCLLGHFLPTEGLFPPNDSFIFFATYTYHVDGFYCFSWEIKLQHSSFFFFPTKCKHRWFSKHYGSIES